MYFVIKDRHLHNCDIIKYDEDLIGAIYKIGVTIRVSKEGRVFICGKEHGISYNMNEFTVEEVYKDISRNIKRFLPSNIEIFESK